MNTIVDDAYKLGCGRLLFEHGALKKIGDEALRLGRRACVVGGPRAMAHVQDAIVAALNGSGVQACYQIYGGPCSEEKAEEIARACKAQSLDLLIGVGGGRILDLIKIVADISALPVITVPTISATCAAFTPLSVVYTQQGECRGTWYFHREVDCVLCDLDILCTQSPRYLAAGMLDAMAKHVEISQHEISQGEVGEDVLLARLIAKTIYDDLKTLGENALRQEKRALERCIFHAIVSTGLVSGIARGRYQSAVAHALYEAIRTRYTAESSTFLHGEIVAVCLIVQSRYLGREDMAQDVLGLMHKVGMPVAFREIGVTGDPAELAVCDPVPRYYLHGDGDADILGRLLKTC